MANTKPRVFTSSDYDRFAEQYLRSLRPEHFMEATGQSVQREITLESLALLRARRPDVHVFNELLLQYPWGQEPRPHQVVPDNMVVLHEEPIEANGSFQLSLQPVGPFWVLEYISKGSVRKDYDISFYKYECELKVPYFLIFYPDQQELTLYRHNKRKYVSVKPNERGRLALPELDLEIGILDDWCRYWYQGELLLLPGALLLRFDQEKLRADQEKHRADQEQHRADTAERELELLRAQLKQTRSKRQEK